MCIFYVRVIWVFSSCSSRVRNETAYHICVCVCKYWERLNGFSEHFIMGVITTFFHIPVFFTWHFTRRPMCISAPFSSVNFLNIYGGKSLERSCVEINEAHTAYGQTVLVIAELNTVEWAASAVPTRHICHINERRSTNVPELLRYAYISWRITFKVVSHKFILLTIRLRPVRL
jgi:hypothetical protein